MWLSQPKWLEGVYTPCHVFSTSQEALWAAQVGIQNVSTPNFSLIRMLLVPHGPTILCDQSLAIHLFFTPAFLFLTLVDVW